MGEVRSHIVWSRGKRHGCEFDKSLTPQQLLAVLEHPFFQKRRSRKGIFEALSGIFARHDG
jgi:hypothetical protein